MSIEWVPDFPLKYTDRWSIKEYRQYHRLRAAQVEADPGYEDWFRLPSPVTASAIWELLSTSSIPGLKPESLEEMSFTHSQLTEQERGRIRVAVQQAVAIAFDTFIQSASQGTYREDVVFGNGLWGLLTLNDVVDALGRGFSDNYQRAVTETPARYLREMKGATIKGVRRDILRHGIKWPELWKIITRRVSPEGLDLHVLFKELKCTERGYKVRIASVETMTPEREHFDLLLAQDPQWRPKTLKPAPVLLADEDVPESLPRQRVCAEQAYNVVTVGERSKKLMEAQSQARLVVDLRRFRQDWHEAGARKRRFRDELLEMYRFDIERHQPHKLEGMEYTFREIATHKRSKEVRLGIQKLCRQYDQAAGVHVGLGSVYDWAKDRPEDFVTIRSGFAKVINRRYDPTHFWPTRVPGTPKDWEQHRDEAFEEDWDTETLETITGEKHARAAMRNRWFGAPGLNGKTIQPLVGVDITASQTQILAIFLGLEDLERELQAGRLKWNEKLADRLWEAHLGKPLLKDGYGYDDGAPGHTDNKLVKLVKNLWMRHLYGSMPHLVAQEHNANPEYWPGWLDHTSPGTFLSTLPWYKQEGGLMTFLDACQELAKVAMGRDPYAGVVFKDPFDGSDVRWNPARYYIDSMTSDDLALRVDVPGHTTRYCSEESCKISLKLHDKSRKRKWSKPGDPDAGLRAHKITHRQHPHTSNEVGDWPVDDGNPKYPGTRGALSRMIAPCLIHTADALFSSIVMERLAALGVRDFVGINDAWLLPQHVLIGGEAREGREVLKEVIAGAGQEWLVSLGPLYDCLDKYLGEHPEYGGFVKEIRQKWEARKAEGLWPKFRFKDE